MNTSRTHTLALILLSIATLCALGAWIFLFIESNTLKTENAQINSKITSKTLEGAYYNSVRNIIKSSKSELLIIEKRFVDKEAIPQFIDLLETKSAQADIKTDFSSIDVGPQAGLENALRVRVTGSGEWSRIVDFVATLEALPYASKIESLSFTKPDLEATKWSFSLELVVALDTNK